MVLKCQNAGSDASTLLDYGFRNFKHVRFATAGKPVKVVQVRGGVKDNVALVPKTDLAEILPQERQARVKIDVKSRKKAYAPVKKGEEIGTLVGYLNGRKIGSVSLVAATSVDRTLGATITCWITRIFLTCMIALIGFISYGTAVAKVARERRRRLASRGGKPHTIG